MNIDNIFYDENAMRKKRDLRFTVLPSEQIDWSQDYIAYSKLSTVDKRKMLRKIEKKIALKDMSYMQAKLFHRLKGRID